MDDERLPKQLFYGEFSIGKRPQSRPKKRFKDCVKSNLKATKIDIDNWEINAVDRVTWRFFIKSGCDSFEVDRIQNAKIKRAIRKGDLDAIPLTIRNEHVCDICGKIALSRVGLASHKRSHFVQPNDLNLTCSTCNRVCRSKAGLKSHMRSHNS